VSFDLGDPVPLTVTITDEDGNLANAGNVALTITLPDGTTVVQNPVTPTEAGVYDYNYETVQAGVHRVRWLATGANACAFTDVINVEPAEGMPFISLADARNHLKKTSTADDEKLRGFIAASCAMVEDRMGHVTPITLTFDGCGRTVILERPVISVISVVRLPGGEEVPEADPLNGVHGWTLDAGAGVLTLSRSYGRVRATVRAGRSPLPGNFRLAGLELTGHLWRTSQHNTSGGRPSLGVDETIVPGVTYALPYNVRQLLGLDKRPREEILVG
jgi:hypothetical protein